MKKEKINLYQLKISSFVTSISTDQINGIKGGVDGYATKESARHPKLTDLPGNGGATK